jgi:hypothetical protein
LGAIADGNTAASVDNAYSTGTGVEGLSIWRSAHTEDVGAFLRDDIGPGASAGSRGTYGPDGTLLSTAPEAPGDPGTPTDPVYTASSTEDAQYTAPSMAFDGDRATQWQAKTADAQRWVQAAYPSARTFDTVTITSYVSEGAAAQRIAAGRVLVEDSTGELVEAARFDGNTAQDLVLHLPQPVSTKRLRLAVDAYTVAGYTDYPTAVVTEITTSDSREAPTG